MIAAAQAVLDGFDVAAAETSAAAEQAGQAALASDARADAVFAVVSSATPAQIATFVSNNFGSWTANPRDDLSLGADGLRQRHRLDVLDRGR